MPKSSVWTACHSRVLNLTVAGMLGHDQGGPKDGIGPGGWDGKKCSTSQLPFAPLLFCVCIVLLSKSWT